MLRRQWICFIACMLFLANACRAEDWPTWRHNAGRSGATSEQLPAQLHAQWTLKLPKLEPAWAEDIRLQFDAAHEPVVVGRSMFLSSSTNDSVSAYDLDRGSRKWRFYTEGPVRFAPVIANNRVYFGADDGSFYCLDADSGALVWTFRAAPSDRTAIGNARFSSVWPMRGGPVIRGKRIYFTVGVWPFEGTMLYSLDLETGDAANSGVPAFTASPLTNQAPQGYLAFSGGNLFIPCGRANVLGIQVATGKPVRLSYSSKGKTDYHVVASDQWVFHGSKIVDSQANRVAPIDARRPVVGNGVAYFSQSQKAVAYDLANPVAVEKKDRRGKVTKVMTPKQLWSLKSQPIDQVHALAGKYVYASFGKTLFAIEGKDSAAEVVWQAKLQARPTSVVAANGRLLVPTEDGSIHCFGGEMADPKVLVEPAEETPALSNATAERAKRILATASSTNGYAVVMGLDTPGLVEQLIAKSELHIIAIDAQPERVAKLRQDLDQRGWYGTRCTAITAEPHTVNLPPYLANLIVAEPSATTALREGRQLKSLFRVVRPYGGVASFEASTGADLKTLIASSGIEGGKAEQTDGRTLLRRVGALPGSADWTHEFGDAANTLMSREKRVKAPLGVLWFGGPSSDGSMFFDRHEWGPSMAVVEGRMYIQGPGKFTCVDVYTGRILWQNEIAGGKSPGRGSNWGPTGYHFVAHRDAIYMTYPQRCEMLDPKTGKLTKTIQLPGKDDFWGRIRIVGERMFVPVFRRRDGAFAPEELVVMNRADGKVLWSQKTDMSFPLMAIGNGKVFCYEGMLEGLYVGNSKIRVRGAPKAGPILNVKAFDIATGDELWTRSTPRSASWLAYSEKDDVLLVSNKQGIDAWRGKDGDELWSKQSEGKGFRGHPENYWDKVIIWNGRILDQRGPGKSYDIKTGTPILSSNLVTDEKQPWEFTKVGHHCNYAIASEHLMTFRAASAGFLDLETGGTSRLEGFRSGCRNSLIPADGVLNAPNFAHGCTCSYSIFTSLALVHVPESDLWSYGADQKMAGRVKRLGVNFAAPGDRRAGDRTLWLNYPNAGGPSPKVDIKVASSNPKAFRLHSAQLKGDGIRWVGASGMRGVSSIRLPLQFGEPEEAGEKHYLVRLHFAEPDNVKSGEHVFDVAIQGETVLSDFDVVADAKQSRTTVVKEFPMVTAKDAIEIQLKAKKGQTLINGVEIHAVEKTP